MAILKELCLEVNQTFMAVSISDLNQLFKLIFLPNPLHKPWILISFLLTLSIFTAWNILNLSIF